ncbi:alpha/beta hydrolase [Bacillus wiedmannii]|uniref:alpha/beta fold hydrolase n=1 Tax=Bacillus wiedmannii TaxID=1890302 RepID=UPI000BFBE148|nr:alpha/beta hydrolase [Bacillus wiedmannii]PHB05558.1 alpha/beta hydrolase [Bacillus wiedmannii]
MATFILVHGAWDGGYVWREVATQLRKEGHEVYTPTLTGLGERSHLAHPGVGLKTYIQDIVNVIHYEKLNEVILVGHSYAGMVITGVAEIIPECIKNIVYIDAMIPNNGDSVMDISGPEMSSHFIEEVKAHGDGWRIIPRNASDQRKFAMPLLAFTQSIEMNNSIVNEIPHTYIEILDHPANWPMTPIFQRSAEIAKEREWDVYSIQRGGHWVMQTNQEELTRILERCS